MVIGGGAEIIAEQVKAHCGIRSERFYKMSSSQLDSLMACSQSGKDYGYASKNPVYINPCSSQADRDVNARLDSVAQGERGRLQRAAMISGFALQKIDPRIPFLLTELLTENTSAEEIMQVLKAALPRESMMTEPGGEGAAENKVRPPKPPITSDEKITRKNSKNLF